MWKCVFLLEWFLLEDGSEGALQPADDLTQMCCSALFLVRWPQTHSHSERDLKIGMFPAWGRPGERLELLFSAFLLELRQCPCSCGFSPTPRLGTWCWAAESPVCPLQVMLVLWEEKEWQREFNRRKASVFSFAFSFVPSLWHLHAEISARLVWDQQSKVLLLRRAWLIQIEWLRFHHFLGINLFHFSFFHKYFFQESRRPLSTAWFGLNMIRRWQQLSSD